MESCNDSVKVSVRYRPGNLLTRPPVKVTVDGGDTFSLSNEGVKRISLAPGMHDFRMRCRFRRKDLKVLVESPTKITIGFCRDCGDLRTRTVTVSSEDELDYERMGY